MISCGILLFFVRNVFFLTRIPRIPDGILIVARKIELYVFGKYLAIIIDEILLFVLPAMITVAIYVVTARTLLTRNGAQRTNKRDKQLTLIFGISCILWVIFWMPSSVFACWDSYRDGMSNSLKSIQCENFSPRRLKI